MRSNRWSLTKPNETKAEDRRLFRRSLNAAIQVDVKQNSFISSSCISTNGRIDGNVYHTTRMKVHVAMEAAMNASSRMRNMDSGGREWSLVLAVVDFSCWTDFLDLLLPSVAESSPWFTSLNIFRDVEAVLAIFFVFAGADQLLSNSTLSFAAETSLSSCDRDVV